jgi:ribosomal protein S19E (S16A)
MLIKSKPLGSVQLRGKYTGKRAENVIKQMNSKGGVIIEQHVLRALRDQGFVFDIEKDNKSVYNPDKLWDSLAKWFSYAVSL